MEYGNYLIAMNASADKRFTLDVPGSFVTALELVSHIDNWAGKQRSTLENHCFI